MATSVQKIWTKKRSTIAICHFDQLFLSNLRNSENFPSKNEIETLKVLLLSLMKIFLTYNCKMRNAYTSTKVITFRQKLVSQNIELA